LDETLGKRNYPTEVTLTPVPLARRYCDRRSGLRHRRKEDPAMPRGSAVLLSLILLAIGACGTAAPPASRTDVERGTALPPPGLNTTAAARR
jgi:hypothetical protein